jgi:transcription antitermination factor NusG
MLTVAFPGVGNVRWHPMWHVLHAAPKGEPHVCTYLGLNGIEAYAPKFAAPPRTKPGSVRDRQHRSVFPGYVFFKLNDGFADWDLIRWAPGVRRMLQVDGAPGTVDDTIVDHIRRRVTERSLRQTRDTFRKGQPVVIESGPLRMVDAIFDASLDAPARVQVLITLLGRPLTVEVDPAILKASG